MTRYFVLVILIINLVSCVPQKEVIYVQDRQKDMAFEMEYANLKRKNKIEVFDELYIQVNSFDAGNLNFMNSSLSGTSARSAAELSLISYRVDEDGYIDLPVLGRIKVIGLTIEESANLIRKELESYLNSPSVKISFVNRSITVLGYVRQAGRYYYTGEYINVFQALGLAGDIQEFGNRKEVVVIREENNKITKHRISLTDKEIFKSPYYYLDSNDIVYVEPLKRRHWGMETFPYALILSSITTFLLVANYIKK